MSRWMLRLPRELRKELETCGAPWEVRDGGKHYKLYVNERFIATLPHGKFKSSYRKTANTIGHIRRAAKGIVNGR